MASADVFSRHGRSTALYVFAHGWGRSPKDFDALRAQLQRWAPDADHYVPRLPLGLMSFDKAEDVAADLERRIAERFEGGTYERVHLVGHSFGALIARAAWLRAIGGQEDGSIVLEGRRPWSERVDRMTFLAALGRGWRPTTGMSPVIRAVMGLGTAWETVGLPRTIIFDVRRGAPFLTTVRLQSLALERLALGRSAPDARVRLPVVTQVLGTVDELVAPADNIDLMTGSTYQYVECPDTDHLNVLRPDVPAREGALRLALTGEAWSDPVPPYHVLTTEEVADQYSDALDDFDPVGTLDDRAARSARVTKAVMVVHGIRDYGFWTKRLAGRVKRLAADPDACRTVTSSYGYFPMAPFLFPAARRRRVEWFLDQYVQTRSLYPNAEVAFIGHSNGTYLLAGALELCRAAKFGPVAFAGSVVRRSYDWKSMKARDQVGRVVNYVATKDVVVAAFPKFLGRLKIFDLGGAGTDGFGQGDRVVVDVRYVDGGHDAAIRDRNWDPLARFVLDGTPPEPISAPEITRSSRNEALLWVASVVAVPMAVAAAIGIYATLNFLFGRVIEAAEPHVALDLVRRVAAAALTAIGVVWFMRKF